MAKWAHVMSSLRGQWLPGDERGFRDHGHRVHSSGNYKNPPPPEEHAGLRAYARRIAKPAIELNAAQRAVVGAALVEKLLEMEIRTAALACCATHTHALIRVGDRDAKPIFGRAKQLASLRMSEEIPGKMWGASSKVVRIRNLGHFIDARVYILRHKHEGAWTWYEEKLAQEIREREQGAGGDEAVG